MLENYGLFLREAMGRMPYQTKYLYVLCEVLSKLWICALWNQVHGVWCLKEVSMH